MSQHSEDLLDASAQDAAGPQSARIIPFERPQSDLQRAVQLRAQETLAVERDREREAAKPAPLRWIIVFAIAMIPVLALFAGVNAFLKVLGKVNASYSEAPVAAPDETVEPDLTSSEPGVILLQPYEMRKAEGLQEPAADGRKTP